GRRLDREQGAPSVLRLGDEFAGDVIWAEGLGVSLDNLLVAFGRLRAVVETVADRLSLDDPSERRAPLVGELRGVVRRAGASRSGWGSTCRRRASWCGRSCRRRSTSRRSACSRSRPTCPSHATTRKGTTLRWHACCSSSPTRRTAACSSCSRATGRSAAPPPR